MKEQNLILLIALVVANLMSDRIKPLVDNMVGKLVLVLTICYLANKHIILGLLGVILYTSIYNGLLEGMTGREGKDECVEGDCEGMAGQEGKDQCIEGDCEGMVGREGAHHGGEIEDEPEEEGMVGREGNDCPEDDQECGGR